MSSLNSATDRLQESRRRRRHEALPKPEAWSHALGRRPAQVHQDPAQGTSGGFNGHVVPSCATLSSFLASGSLSSVADAPDRSVPYEETFKAVNDLYKEGLFKRFGISNYQVRRSLTSDQLACPLTPWLRSPGKSRTLSACATRTDGSSPPRTRVSTTPFTATSSRSFSPASAPSVRRRQRFVSLSR